MAEDDRKFTQEDVNRIVQERLARDREARNAMDPDLLKRITNLEEKLVSERAALAKLEGELAQSAVTRTRAEIAAAKGLPTELVEFVVGSTKEEMAASADKLVASLGVKQTAVGGVTNPGTTNTPPRVYTAQELKSMTPEQVNADWENISAQLKAGTVK
jgi:hypothetical protein